MPHRRLARAAGDEAVMIYPSDLIGAATVELMLGVDRSTVLRKAREGVLPVLAKLDTGTYVFNRPDIEQWQAQQAASKE